MKIQLTKESNKIFDEISAIRDNVNRKLTSRGVSSRVRGIVGEKFFASSSYSIRDLNDFNRRSIITVMNWLMQLKYPNREPLAWYK